jgi:hypothetical protein
VDEQTKSQVTEAASTATDKTRQVADDATQQAKDVAETAREKAGEIGHEVATQGHRVVDEAKEKLREQSHRQSDQLASTLRGWSDEARALAEGRPQEAGQLSEYAQQAAGKIAEVADQVQARGFEGALDDVKSFARRRPGVFLLGAGIAGFAAGRLLRGATAGTAPTAGPSTAASRPPAGTYQPPYVAAPAATGAIGRREV